MPRAALRPSAMAQTISDWPRCMSPAVNTPGTLVIQVASRQTVPRSVKRTPNWASIPSRSGPRNPMARRTSSPGRLNALSRTSRKVTRPSASRTGSTRATSRARTWPRASPRKRVVDTEKTRSPPSS